MRRAAISLLILSTLLFLVPQGTSQEVVVDVEGPSVMPAGGVALFNITAAGGPGEQGGMYNITAFLLGDNLTGASPSPAGVFKNLTSEPHWEINVTVPFAAQTMTFVVNITSSLENESDYREVRKKIRVVGPIILSAEIHNPLEYELREVPVDFYVKGPGDEDFRLVGSYTIETIAPGANEFASFDWIVADPEHGEYRLKAVVDLDRDGIIDESAGDSVAVSSFYIGGGGSFLTYILGALVVLLVVLSIIWFLAKPRRRP